MARRRAITRARAPPRRASTAMAITFELPPLPVFGSVPVFGGGGRIVVVGAPVVGGAVVVDSLAAVVVVWAAVVVVAAAVVVVAAAVVVGRQQPWWWSRRSTWSARCSSWSSPGSSSWSSSPGSSSWSSSSATRRGRRRRRRRRRSGRVADRDVGDPLLRLDDERRVAVGQIGLAGLHHDAVDHDRPRRRDGDLEELALVLLGVRDDDRAARDVEHFRVRGSRASRP